MECVKYATSILQKPTDNKNIIIMFKWKND